MLDVPLLAHGFTVTTVLVLKGILPANLSLLGGEGSFVPNWPIHLSRKNTSNIPRKTMCDRNCSI
jgi:hypothetical protein